MPDRGTPGIEAAAKALGRVARNNPQGFSDRWLAQASVSAFLAVEPPADVLKALLEAQPGATRKALVENERIYAMFEQRIANDQVRLLRREHRCPTCGAE